VFSLGGGELLLVAVVALLLFGPDKIPQMARTVGKYMREFNKYRDIMESTVRAEIYKDEWNKEAAEGGGPSASERISQAAGAVQGLVAEQRATDEAATTADVGPTLAEPAAAVVEEPAGRPGPATSTDEDEEDEE